MTKETDYSGDTQRYNLREKFNLYAGRALAPLATLTAGRVMFGGLESHGAAYEATAWAASALAHVGIPKLLEKVLATGEWFGRANANFLRDAREDRGLFRSTLSFLKAIRFTF